MKIKILKSNNKTTWYSNMINQVIDVKYDMKYQRRCFTGNDGIHNLYNDDIVITELPKSFCVKICDDGIKWGKYIDWLNKTYNTDFCGRLFNFDNPSDNPYYGVIDGEGWGIKIPFGTEIHIDDMIKHIDYMERHINGGEQFHKESQLIAKMDKILKEEEFDLTTLEGRIYYVRKHYLIGTKYIPLNSDGIPFDSIKEIDYTPKYYGSGIEGGFGYIYANGKWAEIVKEETNMVKQKLSRQGLKEIHSVACPNWKDVLEHYGSRNPLEDYIELTQQEVDKMFNACTKEQLPIVSKYLKQDDGSVDLSKIACEVYLDSQQAMIEIRNRYEYCDKAFWLTNRYDWEIKKDSKGQLCLIPTKKK